MHNYTHYNLTFSFEQLWMCNRDHLPNRVLRNADDLRIPAHHFASIKGLPMFSFPQLWNEEPTRKFNPSLKSYSKQLKLALSAPFLITCLTYVVCQPSPPLSLPLSQSCIYSMLFYQKGRLLTDWGLTHSGARDNTWPMYGVKKIK
jgi:hypothetical protein